MPGTPSDPHHARRWLILAVLSIAQLMVVLDATIVNIALPSAQDDLGFSADDRQWVVTAYALAFGSLLLLGGRVSDFFGRKYTFVAGLIGFAGASALGGVAQNFETLIAARALQGAFGALLAPAAMSLITTTFVDAKERAKAFGIFGGIAGGGSAIGLLLGGALTEYASWRWCMYVNLAFAIPAAIAGARLLVHRASAERPKLDIPGTLTASAGLFALVYGLAHAETDGWGSPVTLAFIGGGIALLAGFVALQRRVAHPLLPLRIVLDRNRGGSFLAIGIAGIGMFGVFLFLTFYLQQTLGMSPMTTGLAFLPMTASIMITAAVSTTRIVPRVGPRPLVPTGMLLAAGAMVYLTRLGVDSSYATDVLPALMVMGVGVGAIFAPSMAGATLGVRPEDSGVASATVSTMQQVGGSIGTALLSTIVNTAATDYATSHPASAGLAEQAAVHGYTTAFAWGAVIFLAGAVICGSLLRSGAPKVVPGAAPAMAH